MKINLKLKENFNGREFRKPTTVGRLNVFLAPIISAIIGAISGATAAGLGLVIGGIYISASLISAIVVGAVVIGLTVWSMTSQKGSGSRGAGQMGAANAIDQNGQLVNSRQAAKVLPIVYGVARTGGNIIWFSGCPKV